MRSIARPVIASLLKTTDQAADEAAGLMALLAPGGILIQVVSRAAYAEWAHATCFGWERSLFEVRGAVSGGGVRVDDSLCYVTLSGDSIAELRFRPTDQLSDNHEIRQLDFEVAGSEPETWYVAGNEELQVRAWHHGVRRGRLARYRLRMPPSAPASVRNAEVPLRRRVRDAWVSGRPAVLDPGGTVIGPHGRAIRYHGSLYDALATEGLHALHYPQPCRDLRAYHGGINDWVASLPDVVVLGPGLTDARSSSAVVDKMLPDPDRFRVELVWIIDRLQEEARARVVWMHFEPPPARLLEGAHLQSERIEALAAVGREVAEERSVPAHEIAYDRVAAGSSAAADRVAAEALDAVRGVMARPSEPSRESAVARTTVRLTLTDASTLEIEGADARRLYLAHNFASHTGQKPLHVVGGRTEFERWRQQEIIDWLAANERPNLPRALLIGDAIRMRLTDSTGYGAPAYRLLIGTWNVTHIPHDCSGSSTIAKIVAESLRGRPDLVYLQTGLDDVRTTPNSGGDTQVPPDAFRANLETILENFAPLTQSSVFFGRASRPLVEEWHNQPDHTIWRHQTDIDQYNDSSTP